MPFVSPGKPGARSYSTVVPGRCLAFRDRVLQSNRSTRSQWPVRTNGSLILPSTYLFLGIAKVQARNSLPALVTIAFNSPAIHPDWRVFFFEGCSATQRRPGNSFLQEALLTPATFGRLTNLIDRSVAGSYPQGSRGAIL